MTWRTSRGKRVLTGTERELFLTAFGMLVDEIRAELAGHRDPAEFGIAVFDGLQPWSKLAVLADVGSALIYKSKECPKHTAVSEGAIAAVFCQMHDLIQIEIDMESDTDHEHRFLFRKQVCSAMAELCPKADRPEITCGDINEWYYALQTLSDRILWDQDYLTADAFMDLDPDGTKDARKWSGIDQEYVTAIAPDPSESERLLLLKRLRELYVEIEF
ncbi:MAG: hypothetical protein U0936_21240 [Planctomycetaceae bacterium]